VVAGRGEWKVWQQCRQAKGCGHARCVNVGMCMGVINRVCGMWHVVATDGPPTWVAGCGRGKCKVCVQVGGRVKKRTTGPGTGTTGNGAVCVWCVKNGEVGRRRMAEMPWHRTVQKERMAA